MNKEKNKIEMCEQCDRFCPVCGMHIEIGDSDWILRYVTCCGSCGAEFRWHFADGYEEVQDVLICLGCGKFEKY